MHDDHDEFKKIKPIIIKDPKDFHWNSRLNQIEHAINEVHVIVSRQEKCIEEISIKIGGYHSFFWRLTFPIVLAIVFVGLIVAAALII